MMRLEAVRRTSSGGERREGDWITIQAAGKGVHGLPHWVAEKPSLLWLRVQAGEMQN